jgi:hypothetical protein
MHSTYHNEAFSTVLETPFSGYVKDACRVRLRKEIGSIPSNNRQKDVLGKMVLKEVCYRASGRVELLNQPSMLNDQRIETHSKLRVHNARLVPRDSR